MSDKDLPILGLCTKAGGEIAYGADRRVPGSVSNRKLMIGISVGSFLIAGATIRNAERNGMYSVKDWEIEQIILTS